MKNKGWTIDGFGVDKEKITDGQTVDKERENGSSPHRWSLHHPLSLSPSVSVWQRTVSWAEQRPIRRQRPRVEGSEEEEEEGENLPPPPPAAPLAPRMLCNCCKQTDRVTERLTHIWASILLGTLTVILHPLAPLPTHDRDLQPHQGRVGATPFSVGVFLPAQHHFSQTCAFFLGYRLWI